WGVERSREKTRGRARRVDRCPSFSRWGCSAELETTRPAARARRLAQPPLRRALEPSIRAKSAKRFEGRERLRDKSARDLRAARIGPAKEPDRDFESARRRRRGDAKRGARLQDDRRHELVIRVDRDVLGDASL